MTPVSLLRRLILLVALAAPAAAAAEDGYDLWLRYRPVEREWLGQYRPAAASIVQAGASPTLQIAAAELTRGLGGLLDLSIRTTANVESNGAIVIGTPASSPAIAGLNLPLNAVGKEGYLIRSTTVNGRKVTVIAANSDVGVLYGAFHFLRLIQTRKAIASLDITSAPGVQHRVISHWDNINGTVERGYAGFSLWDWQKLPDYKSPRYTDYARAEASIGINGVVLNNVNSQAASLLPLYIERSKALADISRPYGIKVFFTARFSAPIEIGGLKTADPLDPAVKAWWAAKADEIYKSIPDFGGFLVKANSEGQPGPQDYKRTHAEGANTLADALAPHGGIVMWRAFVYSKDNPIDRIRQAHDEFAPLDGKFRDNVIVQVKNGALDFQPREPFHPLFGATPKTPLSVEFQIAKEYLGLATSMVYLGPLFEEVLSADTYAKGQGSTVAKVIDGSLFGHKLTEIAGDANTGSDRNWSGSQFNQANWYVFGRLAWDLGASSRTIADDWVRMTFNNTEAFVGPTVNMMMGSREAAVDYMMPLGLHHIMARGDHYGPGPWVEGGPRADWTAVYYHHADKSGIGFDRTATGSNAVAQYAPQVAAEFADINKVPEKYLLWFHRVPWDHKMKSGRTLWDELVVRYSSGAAAVSAMRATWEKQKPYVDAQRFEETATYLAVEEKEAKWWRDACLAYFQSFSGLPIPAGYAAPEHSLDYYKSLNFPWVPGHW